MTPRHSIDVITRALWMSGIWLGLAACVLLATGCGAGNVASASGVTAPITKAQALAYARAVSLRPGDVPGGAPPSPGSVTKFGPAPFTCSKTAPYRVGGAVSLVSSPYGFVASAVSVLPNAAAARAQLSALLAPAGRACLPRSLGEVESIATPSAISFKVSAAAIPVPHLLGGEAIGFRVLAEVVSPERELIKKIRETERDKGPPPGAKLIHVEGAIFRVGRAEILFFSFGPTDPLPARTADRLLVLLHSRAEAHKLS